MTRIALLIVVLTAAALGAVGCTTPLKPVRPGEVGELDKGYGTLASLLGDERKVHQILPLKSEGLAVKTLIQEIAAASAKADDELKNLSALEPPVNLQSPPALPMIEQATRDSIAAKTTLDLLFSDDTFETRIMLCQAQALRYGHFLALRLKEADPNKDRGKWLETFATEYERLYKQLVETLQKHETPKKAESKETATKAE